jgi:Mrp family chromosome partitioning ATPase
MQDLHDRLIEMYDYVILDSPPLLPVTDAVVLSKVAGGALVVVGADRIHRLQLRSAIESIAAAGGHVFGLVVNKLERRQAQAYGYGYATSYVRRHEPYDAKTERDALGADTKDDAHSRYATSHEGKRVLTG